MAKKYNYNIKTRGAETTFCRTVVCESHEVIDGILYFRNDGKYWTFACTVESLIEMDTSAYIEPVKIEKLGHVGHVETVLPKEHE
jgi:hypothetical protein